MNQNLTIDDQFVNVSDTLSQPVGKKISSQKNNQLLIIFSLIFIIIILLITTGIFAYKNQTLQLEKTQDQLVSNQLTLESADSYQTDTDQNSWKTQIIPGEKITFQYPSDWEIKVDEHKQDDPVWNTNEIEIISPNNFLLRIRENVDGLGGGCPEECQKLNLPNQVLGTLDFYKQPLHIVLNGIKPNKSLPHGNIRFNVIPKKTCWNNICYGFQGINTPGTTIITGEFISKGELQSNIYMTADDFINSDDLKTAIKILESFSYSGSENISLDENKILEEEKPETLIYENTDFGFSVNYLSNYNVIDNLQLDNKNWKPGKNLSFIDIENEKFPTISLNLDYDGYGPYFPFEIWSLFFDKVTNKLAVVDKNVQDLSAIAEATGGKISDIESNVLIMTEPETTIFAAQQRGLSFTLRYNGDKDLEIEAQFKTFIESFELIK